MKIKFSALLLAVLIALTACSSEPVPEQSSESSQSEPQSSAVSESEASEESSLPEESESQSTPYTEVLKKFDYIIAGNNAQGVKVSITAPECWESDGRTRLTSPEGFKVCFSAGSTRLNSVVYSFSHPYFTGLDEEFSNYNIIDSGEIEVNWKFVKYYVRGNICQIDYYICMHNKDVYIQLIADNRQELEKAKAEFEKYIGSVEVSVNTSELNGKPCKYNTILLHEFETENIERYELIQGGTGYVVRIDDAERTAKITSLLESLEVYNSVDENAVFENSTDWSSYYVNAFDKDGNKIFELGFGPFSVLERFTPEDFDCIPYKTENGEEISKAIEEMFKEKHREDWENAANG